MSDVTINKVTFKTRLKKLLDHWKSQSNSGVWGGATALAIAVGSSSDDLRYLKSISLHLWLLGYELPDTLLILLHNGVHIVTSTKKASLLEPLREPIEEVGLKLHLHTRAKDDSGKGLVNKLFDLARDASDSPVLGTLPKDKHDGKFFDMWSSTLEESGLETVDIAGAVADVLACKDENEILNVKKAAFLASEAMSKFVKVKIEEIVDMQRKVKHAKLSEMTEEAITEPSKVGVKLKSDNVDIAYPPIFQSGGKYDLKFNAIVDDSVLKDDVIFVSLGTRYSSYCANISRTFLIDPTDQQEKDYVAVLAAQEAAIKACKEGATMGSVMEAVIQVLETKAPHLIPHLSKNVGFGMGLEFRESGNVLSTKNQNIIRENMVFNIAVGVSGMGATENGSADKESKPYAIQIADTILVKTGGKGVETLTSRCPKAWAQVSYTIKAEDEDEEDEVKEEPVAPVGGERVKKARFDGPTAEDKRRAAQEQLLLQKNQETLQRLTKAGNDTTTAQAVGRKISEVVSYRNVSDIQKFSNLRIEVDSKAESVLVPLYGLHVPFHITTVKNVTSNQSDLDHTCVVRMQFHFSGNYEPAIKFPNAIMLKELSFKCSDSRHASKVMQDIKVLRASVAARDKKLADEATIVQQEKLRRKATGVFKLNELWVRPGFGGKGRKIPGTLVAHQNGFEFSTPKPNERIEIMYRNIRHAFFQPALAKDMITVIHFHLHNPIMVGSKKSKDVQVYQEVVDVIQTVDGGRRYGDVDEIEEEQRERERRNRINKEFEKFSKRVTEQWEKDYPNLGLEFDTPFRELQFQGAPYRTTVDIMPTVQCLVQLSEMPFLVVTLDDIEIVNLERVGFNLKNFDMAIVFKDFTREVLRIDAIPAKSLDQIKDWLTGVKIKYYESKLNLSWKPILKKIMDDPEGFVEDGGWKFLDLEKSDSDDDEDQEEASEDYQPSGSEAEDAEESSDLSGSDSASLVSDDDEDESASDEDEEEEGKTWDELEEEAKREDRGRRDDSDSEDERAKRKRPAAGGSAASGGGAGNAAKRRR